MKESLQGPLNSAKLRKIAGIKTFSVAKVLGVTFSLPLMSRGWELRVLDVRRAVLEAALCETGSHPRNFKLVVTGGPKLSWRAVSRRIGRDESYASYAPSPVLWLYHRHDSAYLSVSLVYQGCYVHVIAGVWLSVCLLVWISASNFTLKRIMLYYIVRRPILFSEKHVRILTILF